MELLRNHGLPFGVSTCYTSANVDAVSSEEYFDQMVEWGADIVWYFHYMPVGNDAVPELMCTPESAEHLCGKCDAYAKCWKPTAEKLWDASHQK